MVMTAWIVAALALLAALGLAAALRRRRRGAAPAAPAQAPSSPRVEELRRRAVMEALPMPTVVLDGGGRVIESNRVAGERFPFLLPGMTLLEAFGDHELAERVRAAAGVLSPAEFSLRLFVEGRRTFRVLVAPYEVAGAREALVVLSDTSEAVAYQALRSQFVANVSHELKTPLTGLRGLLEALQDPEMDPVTRARFVARCANEAERLEALISDILFLSELEATAGVPSAERSDLGRVAAEEVEALAPEAVVHGVRVVAEPAPPDLWIGLTDRMAAMVVRNLVENAIRYAGLGSEVVVSVRRQDGQVVLAVADDGVGIPEEHLPHVFERFYRVDPSRSRLLGGTGLGLSIVKHIAERFGGRAWADSRAGFGATVRVALPEESAPAAADELPGPRAASSATR
ncbi:MAG: ATP-binding protein [Thermoleophilia bacterium]|jgi:signal transduction histidine kinase|nr:ATP-binding protein [Thermoleophilia bacterium]